MHKHLASDQSHHAAHYSSDAFNGGKPIATSTLGIDPYDSKALAQALLHFEARIPTLTANITQLHDRWLAGISADHATFNRFIDQVLLRRVQ